MLDLTNTNTDDLYRAADTMAPTPTHKQTQANKESLDDSVLTVKTAVSHKKTLKLALKNPLTKINLRMSKNWKPKIWMQILWCHKI